LAGSFWLEQKEYSAGKGKPGSEKGATGKDDQIAGPK